MEINKTELLSILSAIKPALSSKGIIEQGNNYIFTGEEIITYNDQIAISHPYKSDFSFSVPADKFFKIISGIGKDEFSMEYKDNKINISSKGVKAKISTIETNADDIINLIKPSNVDIEWTKLPPEFKKAVELCLFSTSKDMTKPQFTCVSVNHDHIASTDNYRLSHYKLKETMDCSFLIPASAAVEMIKFNITWYSLSDSWIYFNTEEGVIFCARVGEGNFPEFQHLLNLKGTRISLPDGLNSAIETSSIMATGDFDIDKKITISIKDGLINCKGENELGWVEANKSIDTKEELSFRINPTFFSQIINKATTLIHGDNKLLFRTGTFKHILNTFKD